MLLYLLLSLSSLVYAASNGAELALILDTSGSMSAGGTANINGQEHQLPPNDPERASVLGALVIDGLMRGGSDGYQMYFLPKNASSGSRIAKSASDIQNVVFNGSTYVKDPLTQGMQQLKHSSKRDKTLIFLTDGSPSDFDNPVSELKAIFGDDRDYTIFAIGLYQSQIAEDMGKDFLQVLTSQKQDILKLTDNPSDVVPFFMEGFAKVLGSKPENSKISNTSAMKQSIPKYVTEVFIALTSDQAKDAFQSSITTKNGIVTPTAVGDNDCQKIPSKCRYFETYRISHDPMSESEMTLALSGAKNSINYSIIYRYDLQAELDTIPNVEAGEVVSIHARLLFQNKVFVDMDFFTEDHFSAFVEIGHQTIPLNHIGKGEFEATYIPTSPVQNEKVTVFFKNDWMEQTVKQKFNVDGTLELRLVVPNINLGAWSGDGSPIQKCQTIDISQSKFADVVPLLCTVQDLPKDFSGTCVPTPNQSIPSGKQPLLFDVCIESPSCCIGNDDIPATVTFTPTLARYADKVSQAKVNYSVSKTSFWNCYWKEIAAVLGGILFMFIIYGYKKPYNFDEGMAFKQAKTKNALSRATVKYVRDTKNGKKGFYRNAQLMLDQNGQVVKKSKLAVLILEAGPGGTTVFQKALDLEFFNPIKRQWEIVDADGRLAGHKRNQMYRCSGRVYVFM